MTKRIYPELMTVQEVAETLRCHPNTLRNWDKVKILPAVKIGTKGTRRYRQGDVLEFIEKTRITESSYSVIDLFSGCGGLSHGFAKAGFKVLLGVDNWDLSLKSFARNHPGAKTLQADMASISPEVVEKLTDIKPGMVDVVIGGPPCQGFSISGKRNPSDSRNSLYLSFVQFVAHYKPKVFLLENVPNLLSMDNGYFKHKIVEEFSALGYTVTFQKLLASDYGVPQNRRRVMFVGILGEQPYVFPVPTNGEGDTLVPRVTCKDALSDLPADDFLDGAAYPSAPQSEYQILMRSTSTGIFNHETIKHSDKTTEIIALVPDGGNYKNLPSELQGTRKVNIAWTRFSSNKPSHTIDTGHNHHFHYKWNRVPTARESARLQSFEDSFIFCGTKNEQIRQIGNAVPPLLAEQVASKLLNHLNNK